MLESRLKYDAATKRLVYDSGVRGKKALPKGVGRSLNKLARKGKWNGHEVSSVAVHFEDKNAAEHNSGPLKFLGLEAQYAGGVVTSSDQFSARTDFGIE